MLSEGEFRQRLRQALTDSVPADVRKGWSDVELTTWWNTEATKDEALTAYRPTDDREPVEAVLRIGADLIGPRAV